MLKINEIGIQVVTTINGDLKHRLCCTSFNTTEFKWKLNVRSLDC